MVGIWPIAGVICQVTALCQFNKSIPKPRKTEEMDFKTSMFSNLTAGLVYSLANVHDHFFLFSM